MKPFVHVLGTMLVTIGVAACSNESPGSPTANSAQMFTANLSAANEVPPIAGDEAGATGAATPGIAVSADQVNAILANPGAFYFNIHTARNPDGVARGQLRAQ